MVLGIGKSQNHRAAVPWGLVYGVLLSSSAMAGIAVRCDHCSVEAGRAAALAMGHEGTFHVLGVPDGQVRTFSVQASGSERVAKQVGVPEDVGLAVQGLKEILETSKGSMVSNFEVEAAALEVPGATDADAQTFLNNSNLRAMLGDRLPSGDYPARRLTGPVRALLRQAQGVVGLGGEVELDVRMRFADGSSVRYRLRPGGLAQPVADSARTAHGQALPEANLAAYAGKWNGTRAELALVLRQLDALRIPNDTSRAEGLEAHAQLAIHCRWAAPSLRCKTVGS